MLCIIFLFIHKGSPRSCQAPKSYACVMEHLRKLIVEGLELDHWRLRLEVAVRFPCGATYFLTFHLVIEWVR